MPYLAANGINVYYEIQGESNPLLIIGGLANDLTQLMDIIEGLSRAVT